MHMWSDADDISSLHLDHLDLHISLQRVQGIPSKMSRNVYAEIVWPLFLEHSVVKNVSGCACDVHVHVHVM